VRLADGGLVVLDAGTGIRNLGLSLPDQPPVTGFPTRIFLTHFHWDHIQGIPFFAPLYDSGNQVVFHSFRPLEGLETVLKRQMEPPYFPVPLEAVKARMEFVEAGSKRLKHGSLAVYPFPLNHPQGACGYRLESEGAAIVYATDLEHGDSKLDVVLRDYSQGADLLIYDAHYTPEEYASHRGWGHSTWLEATQVARDARVQQLVLFHHAPAHGDDVLSSIVAEASNHFENVVAAREGWTATV
jgi:phosphoribosyl 1,2-cyclic phosphodiesterase